MPEQYLQVPLTGIGLPEARTGEVVALGALAGVWVVTLIRHRF